jgi:hypothetical protein
LNVAGKNMVLEFGKVYLFEFFGLEEPKIGRLLVLNFEYDGKSFIYILDEKCKEDYQICNTKLSNIIKVKE